jgi:hypothetical protein
MTYTPTDQSSITTSPRQNTSIGSPTGTRAASSRRTIPAASIRASSRSITSSARTAKTRSKRLTSAWAALVSPPA